MNQTRASIGILLVVLMAIGWGTVLGGQAAQSSERNGAIEAAQQYRDRELYAMSVQEYERALAQRPTKNLYQEYLDVYAKYYEQVNTSKVRRDWADAMSDACRAYPKHEAFWEQYVQLYLDREDYGNAGKVLSKAKNQGASSKKLDEQYEETYYAFDLKYGSYTQVLPGSWKDDYVVEGRDGFGVVTSKGETILSQVYPVMGPVGTSGQVVVTDTDGKSWLMDAKGMFRVRYQKPVAQAGAWNEGMVPVRLEGENVWSYLSDDGQTVLSGYLAASSYVDGEAAVQTAQGWQIIDTDGEPVKDATWEEIRLDANGAFVQDDRILARSGGSWKIYTTAWKEKEGFSCDDIDICVDGGIAFCKDGKWGFVNRNGKELIAPAYEQARSFSGGVAAVCKDGKWGFINEDGQLVVDYQFADVGYFSPEGSCPVKTEEGAPYQFIQWAIAH